MRFAIPTFYGPRVGPWMTGQAERCRLCSRVLTSMLAPPDKAVLCRLLIRWKLTNRWA